MNSGTLIVQVYLLSSMRPSILVEQAKERLGAPQGSEEERRLLNEASRLGLDYSEHPFQAYSSALGEPSRKHTTPLPQYQDETSYYYTLPIWPELFLRVWGTGDGRQGGIGFVRNPDMTTVNLEQGTETLLRPWHLVEEDLALLSDVRNLEMLYPLGEYEWNDPNGKGRYWLIFCWGLLQEVYPFKAPKCTPQES